MDYRAATEWLFSQLPVYQNTGMSPAKYKIDLYKTYRLMEVLGHPEKDLTCIHVAGTNGKGSVSHMLAAIFQQHGYKTGLYTSPHLVDFRERIRINGQPVDEQSVIDFVVKYKDTFKSLQLSFFEMTVGLALHTFKTQNTHIAIVETGMGGRLDSTNVVSPLLSVITNIGYDHKDFLGETLPQIATEKAGIIKENTPVVIGRRHPETDAVFEKIARQRNAKICFAQDEVTEIPECSLRGNYQAENIRTVLACLPLLARYPLSREIVNTALMNVQNLTGLRGRWEILQNHPTVIADTGHNEDGLRAVVAQLRELNAPLHMVFGLVKEKDRESILKLLPQGAVYYFCQPSVPRGLDVGVLAQDAQKAGLKGQIFWDVKSALEAAKQSAKPHEVVFVGGSTFVVADALGQ